MRIIGPIVGLVALGIGCVLIVALIVAVLDPLSRARLLGFCPVDQAHHSPGGSREIRVFITDGGATGYGGIFVYQVLPAGRDHLLLRHAPAVSIPDSHRVRWIAEDEVEVSFIDPHSEGRIARQLTLR
jgi:hypothetical protein